MVRPSPTLACVVLKTHPHQMMLKTVINQEVAEGFPLRREQGKWSTKFDHHFLLANRSFCVNNCLSN
jgi:hypothetical protein